MTELNINPEPNKDQANIDIVSGFINNSKSSSKLDKAKTDANSSIANGLGSKAILSSGYFDINYKQLKFTKFDQNLPHIKLKQGFDKIMSQIRPELSKTSAMLSQLIHLRGMELLSRVINHGLFRTYALLFGLIFGFIFSLIYIIWSMFNYIEIKIALIIGLYLTGYLFGIVLDFKRFLAK
jgi:hypothetical protein